DLGVDHGGDRPVGGAQLDVVAAVGAVGVERHRLVGKDRELVAEAGELARVVLVGQAVHRHAVDVRRAVGDVDRIDPDVVAVVAHGHAGRVAPGHRVPPDELTVLVQNVGGRAARTLAVLAGDQEPAVEPARVVGRGRRVVEPVRHRAGGDGEVAAGAGPVVVHGRDLKVIRPRRL